MFDFDLVVLGTEIQIIFADDDDRFRFYRLQRRGEVMVIQVVGADVAAHVLHGAGWRLNDFEFRAPGYTQAKVNGRLTVADNGAVAFTGPAQIVSNDPNALSAWLEGRAPPAR